MINAKVNAGGSARIVETNVYKSKQKFHSPRKIVFSEPYEMIPNFMLDNNFQKRDCKYCDKKQEQHNHTPGFNVPFLPFLSSMLGGGGIGNAINALSNTSDGNSNPITNMLSNPNVLNTISKFLFNGQEKNSVKHNSKSDDFNLTDYTRVE